MTLERKSKTPELFAIIIAIRRSKSNHLAAIHLLFTESVSDNGTHLGLVCVCPWIYNVLITNNTSPEATVYTPDKEALLV